MKIRMNYPELITGCMLGLEYVNEGWLMDDDWNTHYVVLDVLFVRLVFVIETSE